MAKKAGDFAPETGWVHCGQDSDGRDAYRIPFKHTVNGVLVPLGDTYPISLPTALDVAEFGNTSLGAMWIAQHRVKAEMVLAKSWSGQRVAAQGWAKDAMTSNKPEKAEKAADKLSDAEFEEMVEAQRKARGLAA
jgi:hypothetical protein